jgi:phospholipid N-methyltransferase
MAHPQSSCFLPALGCILLLAFAGPLATAPGYAQQRAQDRAGLDVHYVPTPQTVVDRMLEIADVKEGDYLIDLGSGDGRIPITAAKKFGIRGMGVDLDEARIQDANENAKRQGVTDKVEFKQQDLFETDISKADVLTMYLLSSINMKLRPRILEEAKPGTRVGRIASTWATGSQTK